MSDMIRDWLDATSDGDALDAIIRHAARQRMQTCDGGDFYDYSDDEYEEDAA
jgi:hypothetical protein